MVTRDDEILEASKQTFSLNLPNSFKSNIMYQSLDDLRHAFILGAMWADQHPYVEESIIDNNVESLDLE